MIVVDPKSGIITDANRMATKYYGYTKKEFIGMPVSNINTLPENEIQEKLKLAETKKK